MTSRATHFLHRQRAGGLARSPPLGLRARYYRTAFDGSIVSRRVALLGPSVARAAVLAVHEVWLAASNVAPANSRDARDSTDAHCTRRGEFPARSLAVRRFPFFFFPPFSFLFPFPRDPFWYRSASGTARRRSPLLASPATHRSPRLRRHWPSCRRARALAGNAAECWQVETLLPEGRFRLHDSPRRTLAPLVVSPSLDRRLRPSLFLTRSLSVPPAV